MPLRILIKISKLLLLSSKLIAFILILSHSVISNAQIKDIHFDHITVNDGLLSDLVRDFYQDSKGFIWFANDTEGVLKYDGYTFTPYTNLHSYNTNQIVCVPYTIAEDQRGLMWFGTTNGVDILDPTTDKFIHYLPDSVVVLSESKNVVYKIFVDRQNVIWIGTRDGIIRLTEKEPLEIVSPEMLIKNGVDSSFNVEYFKFFPEDALQNTNRVYEIYEDQYNNLMLLGTTGLFVFHREKEQFIRIDDDPEGRSRLNEGMFRGIVEDDYGNYWITTANGVFRMRNFNSFVDDFSFDKSKIQFQSFYPSPAINGNFFRTISRDNNGDIWLGGLWSGLYLVKENNSIEPQFFHFSKKLSAANSILDNQLLVLYTDRHDNLWIGHKRVGVDKFSTRNPGFKSYASIVEKHFMGAHLLPIIVDREGDVWIGETGTGLYKFSSNNEEIVHHPLNRISEKAPEETFLNSIYEDGSGSDTLWLGTASGLYYFNKTSGDYKKFGKNPLGEDLFELPVRGIIFEKDWLIVSGSALSVFNLRTGQLTHYNQRIVDSISNNEVSEWALINLFKTKKGDIWVASEHGLHQLHLNAQTGGVSCYQPPNLYPEELPKMNKISSDIQEDRNGMLWIATRDGLSRYNPEDSTMIRYLTQKEGYNCRMHSVEIDNRGRIWCGMASGLACFNPENEKIRIYTEDDGLPLTHHSITGSEKCPDGKMYLTGSDCFYSFYPDSFVVNDFIPEIVITDLSLFGKSLYPSDSSQLILTERIEYTRSIDLKYNQNDISLEFAALDFTDPMKNLYTYTLEGYDDKWAETDAKNRIATYTNLHPGTYTFRVKGSNSDGIWNEEGTFLEIRITQPLWFRWWAYVIYALALFFMTRYYIRFALSKERIKSDLQVKHIEVEKVRELEKMKSRFFTNISHEFRTPLSLLVGPLEDSIKGKEEEVPMKKKILRIMHRNANRLQLLINQLLDVSKLEAGMMELQLVRGDLSKFVRIITSSFASLAESKHIRFGVDIENHTGKVCFDEDKMEKIVNNLLSNALKFTPNGGDVSFKLSYGDRDGQEKIRHVYFTVSDSGIGMDPKQQEHIFDRFYQVSDSDTREAEGTGIGLSLTKELVELFQGTITVISSPGAGTTFKVVIPVDEESMCREMEADSPSIKTKKLNFNIADQNEGLENGNVVLGESEKIILVVEDNEDLRQYIGAKFTDGYQVIQAVNGAEGFEATLKYLPDLIITDLMMPVMGGLEMSEKLKNHQLSNHIPIIMLTAKADKKSKLEGLEAWADDYITKPFDSDELLTRVNNLIRQRQELRKHFEKKMLLENNGTETNFPQYRMLREIIQIYDQHLSEVEFSVELLCDKLSLSKSQLYRKVRSVTGSTPNELLRMIRMKQAARLLRKGELNITQIMHEVGFSHLSHFSASFKKFYGVNPSDYRK